MDKAIGAKVFWHDPENEEASGYGTIIDMRDDYGENDVLILEMASGGTNEVFEEEVEFVDEEEFRIQTALDPEPPFDRDEMYTVHLFLDGFCKECAKENGCTHCLMQEIRGYGKRATGCTI